MGAGFQPGGILNDLTESTSNFVADDSQLLPFWLA